MRPRHVWWACRTLGARWILYRAWYASAMKTALLRRRLPATPWEDRPLASLLRDPALADPDTYCSYRQDAPARFFFDPADRGEWAGILRGWDGPHGSPSVAESEALGRGSVRFFSCRSVRVGFPPDWAANPLTGERLDATVHWTAIREFGGDDIKAVWEPSRFAFAYSLVRAYWRTGDERYPEIFWQLVESWRDANPPHRGPNWKCGQEVSLRLMAWTFGLYGFFGSSHTTPERVSQMVQMIGVCAERIEANLPYALSQRNNHGINEAVGLWTAGILFPELRDAPRWVERARVALERQARELFYDDGGFSQHSANYQRVALHAYLWALRLGELNDCSLDGETRRRVGRAAELLFELQEERTGEVPCHGQNDGALVLPLNNCPHQDYRPVIQAVHHMCTGARRYPPGPWDEDLLWLFGPSALEGELREGTRADLDAPLAGHHTIRAPLGFAAVRCSRFRHRPSHADQLHVDIWWRGMNIALDPGTYSYNAPPPWDNPLARTGHHNTVTVDGRDQMDRASRFLWLPWANGRVLHRCRSADGCFSYWEGEHDGYGRLARPVRHRRALLRIGEEHWVIVDGLTSRGTHAYRLHWLLADLPWEVRPEEEALDLTTPEGSYGLRWAGLPEKPSCSLVRAATGSARGWRAPGYLAREPALSLELLVSAKTQTFVTLLGPLPVELSVSACGVRARTGSSSVALELRGRGSPLVAKARVEGPEPRLLEVE